MNRSTSAPSPLSPTRWPADAFLWWRSLLFAIVYVVVFLLGPVLLGVWLLVTAGTAGAQHPSVRTIVVGQLLAYIPPLAMLFTALPRVAHRSMRELGLVPPTWRTVLWGIGGAIAMYVVAGAIGALEEHAWHVKVDQSAVSMLRSARGIDALGFAFLAVIAAPFVEELTFRGFVFNAFRRYLPTIAAAVLSAIFFGFVHIEPHNPFTVLPLVGGGIILAIVYYYSGALTASMLAHACFNAITVIAVLLLHVKG